MGANTCRPNCCKANDNVSLYDLNNDQDSKNDNYEKSDTLNSFILQKRLKKTGNMNGNIVI